mgnify:CR=1 FL=1
MAKTPATPGDAAARPLADTGHAGLARLRELEGLLTTACQVRRLAETEIHAGHNLERAEQRRDAAARMQRKVERELLKLRSELAGEHPEVNQVWTPGDPVGRKPRACPAPDPEPGSLSEPAPEIEDEPAPGDFELAVMLGTRRSRWEASTSDFSIDQEAPARKSEPAPVQTRARATRKPEPATAPRRTAAARESRQPRGRLLLLVLAGAIAGAGLTYLLSQSPDSLGGIAHYWQQQAARLLN